MHMNHRTASHRMLALFAGALLGATCSAAAAVSINGQVQAGGGAVAGSTVTLWVASAGEPRQLAQVRTGAEGRFSLRTDVTPSGDSTLYIVANGGVAAISKG